MTAVEHMVAWIESSRPHYDRLLLLEHMRKTGVRSTAYSSIAQTALGIVNDAYREATRSGDMFAEQWSARTILDAACALLEWELEQ